MEREIAVLLTLRHPNIVSVYGFVRVAASNNLMMIMDLSSEGSLSSVLKRVTTSDGGGLVAIPWAKRMEILTSVAAGVEFLHSQASESAASARACSPTQDPTELALNVPRDAGVRANLLAAMHLQTACLFVLQPLHRASTPLSLRGRSRQAPNPIAHGDLKCANVLLEEGESMRPRLADFGLHSLEGIAASQHHDVAAGTLRYMAPEALSSLAFLCSKPVKQGMGPDSPCSALPEPEQPQAAGAGLPVPPSPLSMDVYSFGCMVYEVAHIGTGVRRRNDNDTAGERRRVSFDETFSASSLYSLPALELQAASWTADQVRKENYYASDRPISPPPFSRV